MPRAVDMHVHLPTTEFMQVTLGPYAQAAELKLFDNFHGNLLVSRVLIHIKGRVPFEKSNAL
jgi:hypothetical protein